MRAKFSFVVEYQGLGGCEHFVASSEQFDEFKNNPIDLVALHLGVSVTEYMAWVESGGYVQCRATTAKNARCKGSVVGRYMVCSEWSVANKNGGYCHIHGG